jgi:hypothetical protein
MIFLLREVVEIGCGQPAQQTAPVAVRSKAKRDDRARKTRSYS